MDGIILSEQLRVVFQFSVALLFFVAILGLFRYKIVDVFLVNERGTIFGTCRVRLNRFTGIFSAMGKRADRFYIKVFTAPFGAKTLTNVVEEGHIAIVLEVPYFSESMDETVNRIEYMEKWPKVSSLVGARKKRS